MIGTIVLKGIDGASASVKGVQVGHFRVRTQGHRRTFEADIAVYIYNIVIGKSETRFFRNDLHPFAHCPTLSIWSLSGYNFS